MPDPKPYSPEVKAEALELVKVDGLSHEQVAVELAKRYPDRPPARRTVSIWCAQDAELAGLARERIRDLWADQIALNDRLYARATSESDGLKGSQAIIGHAIGVDKELKVIDALTGPKMPTGVSHTGPLVIILGVDRPVPEAIEGEARDVTDDA